MPRSLVLGNGNILVCLDNRGQLRDFYFHYVGLENQMYKGCVGRVGVWIDGQFSWLDSPDWDITVNYIEQTLVGFITAKNSNLQIELAFSDVVYNEKNILIREVTAKNLADFARDIRVFISSQFHLHANKTGNTAFYDPNDSTIVHYKGRRVVVIGSSHKGASFSDYSIGVFGIEGKAGTWLDAEDGILSKNPVEHGPVDSVVGFTNVCDAKSEFSFHLWYAVAKTLKDAKMLHQYVVHRGAPKIVDSTADFWKAWVNKETTDFANLEDTLVDLYKKSLLIIRTHVDNTGGIIASGDSDMLQFGKDTYSYVWPRDAAFISMALDKAGYSEVSRHFFEFANEVISDDGYFYHKYQPDKSLGSSWHPWILQGERSLPIQEDETALVIIALWNHYQRTKDLEFIENIYNSLIKKASNFMLGFRDGHTRLPLPTYDLWEMKNGISTFTASAVSAALLAGSEFARLLGKERDSQDYRQAAEEIKHALVKYLWNEEDSYFHKHIRVTDDQILHDKTIDVSSFYGVFKFGMLGLEDPKVTSAYRTLLDKLTVSESNGALARFEDDIYYQRTPVPPGNPWIITTLWSAQYLIACAKKTSDLKEVHNYLLWVAKNALSSGILPEQVEPQTHHQVSASPLIWSHAEYVVTVLEYIQKYKELS